MGVEKGLKKMIGDDSKKPIEEICVECGKKMTDPDEIIAGPSSSTKTEGLPYCTRCYAKNFSKGDCLTCKMPVLGLGKPWVQQNGLYYHKDCYTDGVHCSGCGKEVFGEVLDALGKVYHPACFKCEECGKGIMGSFVSHEGKPWCKPCHQNLLTQKARQLVINETEGKSSKKSADIYQLTGDFKKVNVENLCDKCLEPLSGAYLMLPDGKQFHEGCISCAKCHKPFEGRKMGQHGGKYYHPNCLPHGDVGKCAKCSKPISGTFLKRDGQSYHSTCFTCSTCSTSLAGKPFAEINGSAQCEDCINKIGKLGKFGNGKNVVVDGEGKAGFTVNPVTGKKEFRDQYGMKIGGGAK